MITPLSAGLPLEPPVHAVGRTSTTLIDSARDDRTLLVDCWYPAVDNAGNRSVYELLPGVGFTATAVVDAPAAAGSHPLVVWSHGRSGTRTSYVMLCEGLAARGYVVVSADHPGDTLFDWMTGSAVDDETNEQQRVQDVRHLLDVTLAGGAGFTSALEFDESRIAVAGHSYGAWTAYAFAGADPVDARVGAVAGLQPFMRSLPKRVLGRISAPALIIAGAKDQTTPSALDADRGFAALVNTDALRVDVEHAGHQACSDVGLYLEVAPHVENVPEIVTEFVSSMADQVTGTAGDPWRPTVGFHLRMLGAFLDDVFDRDRHLARAELMELADLPGVTTRRTTVPR